ncbi:hypothetical protein GCM10010207_19270 [Streptomyces atratus]|nr:hypothetical protein GCM10010207_19270 [Streptomyces atratus]
MITVPAKVSTAGAFPRSVPDARCAPRAAVDRVREDLDDGHQDPAATCAQHREIVEAIEAADGERAVHAMCTHFDGIRGRLQPVAAP